MKQRGRKASVNVVGSSKDWGAEIRMGSLEGRGFLGCGFFSETDPKTRNRTKPYDTGDTYP